MKLIKPQRFTAGNTGSKEKEEPVEDISFNVFKFNNRPKPSNPKDVLIISCFYEFGCESVAVMYCIPKFLRENSGKYTIAMGWHGREYLYRGLVDEFWEVKEDHQWLRDYCRAFHHVSKNLDRLEKKMREYGRVVPAKYMGRVAVGNTCRSCGAYWGDVKKGDDCRYCQSKDVEWSIFANAAEYKKHARCIPFPSQHKQDDAKSYLKENPVGIFARGRKTYGRNLQPEFYVNLVNMLEDKGYNPVWLGEKQNVLPLPDAINHIPDFSNNPKARDLEFILALIRQMKFTVQYWTASTRFASMMGVPYILFESPEQIWGQGQEGYRRNLCDFGPSKLVISHYLNVYENNDKGLEITKQAIEELEVDNYKDIIGLVNNVSVIEEMRDKNYNRIGGE